MKPSLLVVADRGVVKIYDLGGSAEIPRLLGESHIDGVRWRNRVTDQAGSFPSDVGGATEERMTAEAGEEMRAFREIGAHVVNFLNRHPRKLWLFAAPSEINAAILDHLPVDAKERLMRNLPLDLVNVPASELLAHLDRA